MTSEIRDCVRSMVAGLRGEKRAAMDDETREALARLGASLAGLSPLPFAAAVKRHSPTSGTRGVAYLYDLPPRTRNATKILESVQVEGVPLRKWLSSHGIGLVNSVEFGGPIPGPSVVARSGRNVKFLDGLGRIAAEKRGPAGMMFLGFKDSAPESAIRSITAHEVGHAARLASGKLRPRLYGSSKNLLGVLSAIGLIRASVGREISGREAAGWQAAAALSALPMLHEEVQASRIGSRLAGLRGLKRLGSFRGVPSYVAAASIPAVAYGIRKLLNRVLSSDKK